MPIPTFTSTIDIPLGLAIYVAAVLGTSVWLNAASPANPCLVDVSKKKMAWRILLLLLAIMALCYLANIALWATLLAVLLFYLLGFLLGGQPGFVVVAPLWGISFFVVEFVLGFPNLILKPPTTSVNSQAKEGAHDELVGKQAVTVTSLRPYGTIIVDESTFPAVADEEGFLDAETSVTITGTRDGVYTVISKPAY